MPLGLINNLSKSKGRRGFASSVAMNFDGSADAIIIPDHADFNHDTGSYSKFTVSFWFKADYSSGTLSDTEVLMGRWDLNNKREWFIYVETDRKIKVGTSDDGTSGGNIVTLTTTHTISDTDWHHFIMRYDGNQSATWKALVYIDGVSVLGGDTGTTSSGDFAQLHEANQDTWIGATHNNGTAERHFNGKIDEVAYWKGSLALGGTSGYGQYIYNGGNPRDLSYTDGTESLKGYWRMGEYATAGCPVPSGTFPNGTWNPQDSSKYGGSCAPTLVALNWAGGKPRKIGANLITNGNFADGGPALASDETSATVNGWISNTDSAGAVITTDTSIYRSEGKSAKITTDADGTLTSIGRDTNASLEDGEFYVLEYWIYTPTDVSDSGSQEWGRTKCELDECIEGDAQYGLSGDGNIASSYLKINQWHRHIMVGRYNKGSDAAERASITRQFGQLDAGEGPQIIYIDDISVYKLSGTHHGLVQSPSTAILDAGAG
jgi:hypothetical protein